MFSKGGFHALLSMYLQSQFSTYHALNRGVLHVKWAEQMVTGQVWKKCITRWPDGKMQMQLNFQCFDRSSVQFLTLCLLYHFQHCTHYASLFPLHFNSMSCIHSLTSDHPALHHNQMILIIFTKWHIWTIFEPFS